MAQCTSGFHEGYATCIQQRSVVPMQLLGIHSATDQAQPITDNRSISSEMGVTCITQQNVDMTTVHILISDVMGINALTTQK